MYPLYAKTSYRKLIKGLPQKLGARLFLNKSLHHFIIYSFPLGFNFKFFYFQVTMNSLWFGMQVDEATDTHRIHHQLVPNEIRTELGFDTVRKKSQHIVL